VKIENNSLRICCLNSTNLQGQQSKTRQKCWPCEHFPITCHNSKFRRLPFLQSPGNILVRCNGECKFHFASSCALWERQIQIPILLFQQDKKTMENVQYICKTNDTSTSPSYVMYNVLPTTFFSNCILLAYLIFYAVSLIRLPWQKANFTIHAQDTAPPLHIFLCHTSSASGTAVLPSNITSLLISFRLHHTTQNIIITFVAVKEELNKWSNIHFSTCCQLKLLY
jgi:hypothetical protein